MLKLHKSDSTCRVCKHRFDYHCLYIKVEQGGMIQPFVQPLEIVPCSSYSSHGGGIDMSAKCGCLTWEPMDNLEYLELKEEQANKITEEQW